MTSKFIAFCFIVLLSSLSCTSLTPKIADYQTDPFDNPVTLQIVTAGQATKIGLTADKNKTIKEAFVSPGGAYLLSTLKLKNAATQLLSDSQYIYSSTQNNELLVIELHNKNLQIVARFQFPDTIMHMVLMQKMLYIALANRTISALDVSQINNIKQVASYQINKDLSIFAMTQRYFYCVIDKTKIAAIKIEQKIPAANTTRSLHISKQIDMAVPISDIKIVNGLGYITAPGLGLAIVDISTPNSLRIIDRHATSGTALQVNIAGDYGYVADGPRGLTIFNIRNPNHIRWIGSNNKLGPVFSVDILGARAFVNNDNYRLATLNIDNPELPIIGDLYKPQSHVLHLTTQNDIAYTATEDSILAIDFSVAGNQQISNEGINLGGSRRAFIKDNIAYVADWFSGLHMYDISIPQQPRHLGNFHTPGSSKGVIVRGRYAYIADDDHGLQIVDISQPQNPKWVSSVQTSGLAYTMAMVGNLIYLADHRGGLHIIDVADINKPKVIGRYDTPGKSWAVAVENNIAYVADDLSGLLIFDVGDPSQPKKIAEYNNGGYAEDVFIRDKTAYVAFFDKGLYILDISQPQKPVLIGHIEIPGNARSVSVVEQYAYIAGWESGLQIVDISQPASPKIVGAFDTDGSAWGLDIKDQFAYVWDWWGGVKVIHINNPYHPRLAGKYQSHGRIENLAINGNYLYTANGSRGVQAFDIRNPLNPIWTTGLDIAGTAVDIDIEANIAYVAMGDGGVLAADISDPFFIRWLGNTATSGNAYKLRVFDKQLYVADNNTGLNVIDANNPENLFMIAQYPMQINDMWLQNNKLFVASNETGLNVYTIENGNSIKLDQSIEFSLPLTSVTGNQELLFTVEAHKGIHILQAIQNKLVKVALIPIMENVIHIEANADQLFVAVENIGLQTYDIKISNSPALVSLYPATEKFAPFKLADTAVFFAGKSTISSIEFLPETPLLVQNGVQNGVQKDNQTSLSIPATLPIGPYHLTLTNNIGKTTFIPNAFQVKRAKRKKSKFTMDDFKKILKQKTYKSNK